MNPSEAETVLKPNNEKNVYKRKKGLSEAETKVVTRQIAILEENNSFSIASVHDLTPTSKELIISFSKMNALERKDVQPNLRQVPSSPLL